MKQIRIRKRGKTYSYAFEAGKKPDGRRNPIEKGGFATKTEAYEAGVEAYNSWKHGNIGITSEKITLHEFLELWLKVKAEENLKPTTMKNYKIAAKKIISPYIGDIILQELRPKDIDSWIKKLCQRYSKKSISMYKTVLSIALKYAIYPCELIANNPADFVTVPKIVKGGRTVKRTIIDYDMLNRIFEAYPRGTSFYIIILLLMYTGMRSSEACGLCWSDIDFEKKTIYIERQLQLIEGKVIFTPPKTVMSERTVLLPDMLVSELKHWKEVQEQNVRKVHNYLTADGYIVFASDDFFKDAKQLNLVCTRRSGEYATTTAIDLILQPYHLNTHSFRHTHATKLAEAGALNKAIAARLGHASTNLTDNLYTHHTEKMAQNLVEIIDKKMLTNPKC